jgi:hypothetical protein
MTTVLGADPIAPRPEDIAAAKRRALVQQVFESNKAKDALMAAMTENQISVTELAQAMDYKLDAVAYLRDLGCPDGFMGLKVWPQSELDKYWAWHAVTPNALNLANVKPSPAQVQAVMDREFAAHAISPAHAIPWHVQD